MDADANANANADAGGSTIALHERCSGELKRIGSKTNSKVTMSTMAFFNNQRQITPNSKMTVLIWPEFELACSGLPAVGQSSDLK